MRCGQYSKTPFLSSWVCLSSSRFILNYKGREWLAACMVTWDIKHFHLPKLELEPNAWQIICFSLFPPNISQIGTSVFLHQGVLTRYVPTVPIYSLFSAPLLIVDFIFALFENALLKCLVRVAGVVFLRDSDSSLRSLAMKGNGHIFPLVCMWITKFEWALRSL